MVGRIEQLGVVGGGRGSALGKGGRMEDLGGLWRSGRGWGWSRVLLWRVWRDWEGIGEV